jgi:alpha-L-fucosidase 2
MTHRHPRIVVAGLLLLTGVLAHAEPPRPEPSKLPPGRALGERLTKLSLTPPIDRWDEGLPLGNGGAGVLVWGGGNILRLSLDRADLWDTREPEIFSSPDWNYEGMIRLKNEKNHAEHQRLFDVPYDTIPYPTKLPVARLEIVLPTGQAIDSFRLDFGSGTADVGVQQTPTAWGPLSINMHDAAATTVVSGLPEGTTLRLITPAGVSKLGYPKATEGRAESMRAEQDLDPQPVSEVWFVQPTSPAPEGASADATGPAFVVAAALRRSQPPHKGQPWIRSAAVTIVRSTDVGPDLPAAPMEASKLLEAARERAIRATDVYRSGDGRERMRRHFTAFGQSSVRLPDPRLQNQYDLVKHLLIAGSRPGFPPLALQGVWTADEGGLPPWKGDYHNDLNTQMTYVSCEAAGLFDQSRAWLDFNVALTPAYERFAREFYRAPGLIVPGVMTIEGRPMGGWGQHSLSPTHSAWIAHQFYTHWRYTRDRARLEKEWYPFVSGVARALAALVKPDDQGLYRLPLSSSPEINDNSFEAWLTPNSTYDDAMLRAAFGMAMEMAVELGLDADAAAWRTHLSKCTPLPTTGPLPIAAGMPYASSHRHFSHAIGIYPLGLLHTDHHRSVIDATLDELHARGTDWWTGYSFSWMSAMAARAGQGERALEYLEKYLAFTGRNGFHLNGDQTPRAPGEKGLSNFTYRPFTLEGNMIAMQAVHEMLLQSWGEVGTDTPTPTNLLRIFPAVSERWRDIWFKELRAEGGLLVSASRNDGRTTQVVIKAPEAGTPAAQAVTTVRVLDPFDGDSTPTWSKPPREIRKGGEGGRAIMVFDLAPGESVEGLEGSVRGAP